MRRNKGIVISVFVVAFLSVGNAQPSGATSGTGPATSSSQAEHEFEGNLVFHRDMPVGLAAGTAEYPKLVEVQSIRFESVYGNAWGVTACVGWLPVKDAAWRLGIELLDEKGHLLRHSRDEPTVFRCKAGEQGGTDVQYADLDLGAMHDQGRRHAARFRVRLELSQGPAAGADAAHTLDLALVDRDSREPVAGAAVVVSSSYLHDTFQRGKTLYTTDSQGRCRMKLAPTALVLLGVSAQKQGFVTIEKSWANSGSWSLGRRPIVNLPQTHVLEMVRASALGGIVQDTEGKTIEGAEVRLQAHLEEPSGAIRVSRTILTDAKGCWRVEGVPFEADQISVALRHPAYGSDNVRNRQLGGDGLVNARAFKHVETLEKGLMMTGRVLDGGGQAVAGATVMLALQTHSPQYALTDASGAFQLPCSSDQSAYREAPAIIVEAPGYAPARQTIDLPLKAETLEFRLTPGRNITCRVVDTKGRPVVGAWTVVEPLADNRDYSVWLKDTDDRGEFQIPNVPQNDVKLTIGKEGYLAIRDRVVTASENEIVVAMKRALHVQGTVTDAKTGKPISNFEIATVSTSGGRTDTSRPVAFVEGAYELSCNEAQPESLQLQVSAVGYEPAMSQEINVDEGEHAINFKLTRSASFDQATAGRPREQIQPSGPRRITGIVRDEQGRPVPDAAISTYPRMAEESATNLTGAFTLKLRGASGSMGTMAREETTYLLARHKERNLAAVMVLDTSADTIEVTLAPGAILSGKVVDAEGKGIRSAELSLIFRTSSVGYGSRETTEIDEVGRYEIRAIPPGRKYSVEASAEGYGERYVEVDTGAAANERIELEPLVLALANLSASGVVVDELDQPVSGLRIYAYGNGQPSRETFTDAHGRFTIGSVCPGPLNIQANSQAGRRLHGRTQAQGGATDIKIIVEQMDERGRRVPKEPPSLAGRPLPELKELGVDLPPAETDGKMLLVCFWDMEQRPSRNCLMQLAKQAEALRQKGVLVVGVQASKADQNALDEWVKKYNVPFSVGMVQGDAEKARFSWGVRSLPWLILTDRSRVIRKAGFGLDTLDAVIEEMNRAAP